MKKVFLSAAIVLVTLVSCKNESVTESMEVSKENIMGTYKISAIQFTSNGNTVDGLKLMSECEKDNLLFLRQMA